MYLTIITISLVLYGVLAVKKPGWAFFVIPLLLPTYLLRFNISFVPTNFLEVLVMIFTLIWLIRKISKGELVFFIKELRGNNFILPIIILIFAVTLSVFRSPDLLSALGIWKSYFIIPILFYFVFIDIVKTKKDINKILWALGISATLISAYGIIQFFTGWGMPVTYSYEGLKRATSIYKYPAALGLFVAPIFTMICGSFILSIQKIKEKKILKNDWIVIVMLIVMGFALLLSKAEGAWIGITVALFFSLMFTRYRVHVLSISIIILIVVIAAPSSRDYVIPLITFQDVSGDVRLAIWQGTIRIIQNNPVLGAGLSGFPALYEQYKEARHTEISLYPHNMFLNFWVETGILGLIAMILLIIQYFRNGFRELKKKVYSFHIPLISIMVCILIYGLVDVPYLKNDLSILFWIWIGLMTVSNNKKLFYKK